VAVLRGVVHAEVTFPMAGQTLHRASEEFFRKAVWRMTVYLTIKFLVEFLNQEKNANMQQKTCSIGYIEQLH